MFKQAGKGFATAEFCNANANANANAQRYTAATEDSPLNHHQDVGHCRQNGY
jgi:hypothetical protein